MHSKLIFLFAILLVAFGAGAQQEASTRLLEGPAGIYLFTGSDPQYKPAAIYRSAGDSAHFKKLSGPLEIASRAEFDRLVGREFLVRLARDKKLGSEREAYDYVRAHPNVREYGFVNLNPNFQLAMGAGFLDEEMKGKAPGTRIYYRLEFGARTVTFTVIAGTVPSIAKPAVQTFRERDSVLDLSWTAPIASSPDALFGIVYRRRLPAGRFAEVGRVLANRDEQAGAIRYSWEDDSLRTGQAFEYYLAPVNYVGQPGPLTDTTMLIAHDFRLFPTLGLNEASDSAQGIHMSWNAPSPLEWYSGMVIERSKDPYQDFVAIDTLPAAQTEYLDARIQPSVIYYYRLRLLSIRNTRSDPSAARSVLRNAGNAQPDAPADLKVVAGANNTVALSWTASNLPFVSGYLVYRERAGFGEPELVTTLQPATTATDTLTVLPSGQYTYTVRAVGYSGVKSLPSGPAFFDWVNPVPPGHIVLGLRGYSEGRKNVLIWKELRDNTNGLTGYTVYRRSGNRPAKSYATAAELRADGFTALQAPGTGTEAGFTDLTVERGDEYQYSVTATNIHGQETPPCSPVLLTPDPVRYYAPASFFVRTAGNAVVIDWGLSTQELVAGYEVYRRQDGDAVPKLLGKVSASDDSFTDRSVQAGNLYYYSVRTVGQGSVAGEATGEKSVRP